MLLTLMGLWDKPQDIIKNLRKIKTQSIDSDAMPPGNLTGITQKEKETIENWISQGAIINN